MKKKIWKRAAAGTMALAMAASLSACGGKEAGSTGGGSANVPSIDSIKVGEIIRI